MGSYDTGFYTRNSWTTDEEKELVEIVTLPDCKDDVKDDNGIADAPHVPSHSEAHGLINKLTMGGGARWLQSRSLAASPQATAEHSDEAIYTTYAAPHNKLLLLTNAATRHACVHCLFDIVNNQIFMNILSYL